MNLFSEDYTSILRPPQCLDLTNNVSSSGINFIDQMNKRYYKITSDDLVNELFTRIKNDRYSMSVMRFAERSFDRSSGVNFIVESGVDVKDESSMRSLCAAITRVVNEIATIASDRVAFYICGRSITMPCLRMTYINRVAFINYLNDRFKNLKLKFTYINPITDVVYAYNCGVDSLGEISCDVIVGSAIIDRSVFMSNVHSVISLDGCAIITDYATRVDKDTLAINARALDTDRVLSVPEIAFAHDMIVYIRDNRIEYYEANRMSILAALVPKGAQCLFYRGRLNHDCNLIDMFNYLLELHCEDESDREVLAGRDENFIDLIHHMRVVSSTDYEGLLAGFIRKKLLDYASTVEFTKNELAEMLYFVGAHCYATKNLGISTRSGGSSYEWYEFVEAAGPTHYKWLKVVDLPQVLQSGLIPSLFRYVERLRDELSSALEEVNIVDTKSAKEFGNVALGKIGIKASRGFVAATRLNRFGTDIRNMSINTAVNDWLQSYYSRTAFLNAADSDVNTIGVKNGILVLGDAINPESRLIRGYHPYAITRTTTGGILPATDRHVTWLRDQWTNYFYDAGVADWIMMYWSQALNDRVKPVLMLFIIAPGSHGKTFWTELASNALNEHEATINQIGGYACKINPELFSGVDSNANSHTTAMMKLVGKRFGIVSEAGNHAFSTIVMKRIFSQEALTGRRLFKEEETIIINMVATYISNFDPKFDMSDYGSRRRIRCYKPKYKYVEDPNPANPFERMVNLDFNKKIKSEQIYRSAMLTLMLEAHDKLQRDYGGDIEKVPIPRAMLDETSDILYAADHIYQFAVECLCYIGADEYEANMNIRTTYTHPIGLIMRSFVEWFSAKPGKENVKYTKNLEEAMVNSILGPFIIKKESHTNIVRVRIITESAPLTDIDKQFSRYQWV